MKKITILNLFMVSVFGIQAQTAKDALNAKELVFYGLDFTKAKFVGQFDQGMGAMPATADDMKNKWIPEWNALIAKEPQNFKLKEAFHTDNIYYDQAPINTVNSKINGNDAMSANPGKIERADIETMVKQYPKGDKTSGTGLVFIVENFNKNTEMADVYVTYFDIATKKVLLAEKESGKTMGVGMRNYWAGAIKSIIKKIDKEDFKSWQGKN